MDLNSELVGLVNGGSGLLGGVFGAFLFAISFRSQIDRRAVRWLAVFFAASGLGYASLNLGQLIGADLLDLYLLEATFMAIAAAALGAFLVTWPAAQAIRRNLVLPAAIILPVAAAGAALDLSGPQSLVAATGQPLSALGSAAGAAALEGAAGVLRDGMQILVAVAAAFVARASANRAMLPRRAAGLALLAVAVPIYPYYVIGESVIATSHIVPFARAIAILFLFAIVPISVAILWLVLHDGSEGRPDWLRALGSWRRSPLGRSWR